MIILFEQFFISKVDAELFQRIDFEVLKAKDI